MPKITPRSTVLVDVVIPVFNEERALPGCVAVLRSYLTDVFPFDWTITIVDNASTDRTAEAAERLAARCAKVRVLRLDRRGKGYAVRTGWLASSADVVAYMDVDLSTGLGALLPLVASLLGGHADIAVGSRLAPGARVVRRPLRAVLSRGYNVLTRLLHRTRLRDMQCGFKAARSGVIAPLLAHIENDTWFFDTELLLLAEHNGLRVQEVPVDWVEDGDSRIPLAATALTNLLGLVRIAVDRFTGAAVVPGLTARPVPRPIHPAATPSRSRRPAPPVAAAPALVEPPWSSAPPAQPRSNP